MMSWYYKGKEIKEIPEGFNFFVYKITNTQNNMIYIGYKGFYTTKKKNLLKKEISADKRKKTYKKVTNESNWKTYNSSSKFLAELIKDNPKFFKKEILMFCKTKLQARYYEAKLQFQYEVLEKEDYSYNENILGKFYRKNI